MGISVVSCRYLYSYLIIYFLFLSDVLSLFYFYFYRCGNRVPCAWDLRNMLTPHPVLPNLHLITPWLLVKDQC